MSDCRLDSAIASELANALVDVMSAKPLTLKRKYALHKANEALANYRNALEHELVMGYWRAGDSWLFAPECVTGKVEEDGTLTAIEYPDGHQWLRLAPSVEICKNCSVFHTYIDLMGDKDA